MKKSAKVRMERHGKIVDFPASAVKMAIRHGFVPYNEESPTVLRQVVFTKEIPLPLKEIRKEVPVEVKKVIEEKKEPVKPPVIADAVEVLDNPNEVIVKKQSFRKPKTRKK